MKGVEDGTAVWQGRKTKACLWHRLAEEASRFSQTPGGEKRHAGTVEHADAGAGRRAAGWAGGRGDLGSKLLELAGYGKLWRRMVGRRKLSASGFR